ncbi:MAG: LytR/AlgR family response regulator transcription factor, partial [bacterium]
ARLRQAVDRARETAPGPGRTGTLFVRTRTGIESVGLERIVAIAAAGDYSELQLTDGRRLLHDKSLAGLERLLPAEFLRVHRAHIANMRYFIRTRGSSLELAGETVLPVSRRRASRVLGWLRRNAPTRRPEA